MDALYPNGIWISPVTPPIFIGSPELTAIRHGEKGNVISSEDFLQVLGCLTQEKHLGITQELPGCCNKQIDNSLWMSDKLAWA